jgi:cytochrome P450
MMLYPEVQERAQNEIDAIVGMDRLPDFGDRPSLPYVEAILRETLRWHPVFPLGKYSSPLDRISTDQIIGRPTTLQHKE